MIWRDQFDGWSWRVDRDPSDRLRRYFPGAPSPSQLAMPCFSTWNARQRLPVSGVEYLIPSRTAPRIARGVMCMRAEQQDAGIKGVLFGVELAWFARGIRMRHRRSACLRVRV